jgi:hypothetical protein
VSSSTAPVRRTGSAGSGPSGPGPAAPTVQPQQVERRAPGVCGSCPLQRCPIEDWPDDPLLVEAARAAAADDPDVPATAGPSGSTRWGLIGAPPEAVWLTAESLGDADPALARIPTCRPCSCSTSRSCGSGCTPRLVFLAETLGDLATRRTVEVRRGIRRPVQERPCPDGPSPRRSRRCPAGVARVRTSPSSRCIRGRGCAVRRPARSRRSARGEAEGHR